MTRVMAAWSIMLSVRRCMGLKAGLLGPARSKLGPCVALHCCWPYWQLCAATDSFFFTHYF